MKPLLPNLKEHPSDARIVGHVMETRDYSFFRHSESNRPSKDRRKLARLLTKYGWISSMPLSAYRNGSGFVVIDGANRFEQAKVLGIPVRYVQVTGSEIFEPSEVNEDQRSWDMKDFVNAQVKRGNVEYIRLRDFQESTGIEYGICISLLSGHQAASGNYRNAAKCGAFKIRTPDFARRVAIMADACAQHVKWAKKKPFVDALSKCEMVEGFSAQQFIDRVAACPGMLRNCAGSDDFLNVIEEIYNHRSQGKNRLSLAFLARERAKQRNPVNAAVAKFAASAA